MILKRPWAWGGDYSGPKNDWMHFEFMGNPADADEMTALALQNYVNNQPNLNGQEKIS